MQQRLYHYTDAKGLMGILSENDIILWATRYDCLNDPLEYIWAQEHIKPNIEILAHKEKKKYDPEMKMYPYIVSFCKKKDDLCMWRLYGDNGRGFILEFDIEGLQNFIDRDKFGILQKVKYANDDNINQMISQAIKEYNYVKGSDDIIDCYNACALVKKDDYEFEHEYRLLKSNYDCFEFNDSKEVYDGENYSDLLYRESSLGIIPYMEIKIPKEILKRIIIGYGHCQKSQNETISNLLHSRGYKDVKICTSKFKY